ncbi:serine protease [Patulibacter americanus]|uniref:serine protease n=1 Tax=Patulibacter americanus TaxID=588672 RepID=UPI0003B692BE|nr:serine protease [Patulibacter americanus]
MSNSSTTRRRGVRTLGLLAATSALAAGVPSLASAADGTTVLRSQAQIVKPQIVGGSQIQVTRAPWQVLIEVRTPRPGGGVSIGLCGGSLVGDRHIVTAAHCTYDGDNQPKNDLTEYTVYSGVSDRSDLPLGEPGDNVQQRTGAQIASVTRHPGYVSPGDRGTVAQFVNDVAVITLATPLVLDPSTPSTTRPIALPAAGPNPGTGTNVFVSGFGLQADGTNDPNAAPNGHLYGLDTALVDAADAAGPYNALYLVTQSGNGSTCSGDSGGGLVQGETLVGVVSSGARCGVGETGNFTALTAGENLTFVRNVVFGEANPIPRAPIGGSEITVRAPASPQVGDQFVCSPGGWANDPSFTYAFTDTVSGALLQNGPSGTYTATAGDVGRRVSCRVTAVTAGGVGVSLPTQPAPAIRALPVAAPKPTPKPKPKPKPDPARLRATVVSGSSTVKQGSRVAFRITVRNTGDVAAKSVRTCVRVNSRFSVVSRGGAKLTGGRLCWTTSSLKSSTTKRFSLRADRDAKVGRVATTVSVTAPSVRSASARRVVTIARRATAAAPGGVTG